MVSIKSWGYIMVYKLCKTPLGFKIYLDVDESLMMKQRADGVYEEWIFPIIDEAMDDDGIFIDAGANKGYHSLYVASKFPNAWIISYEPESLNVWWFTKSIRANGFKNITVMPYALSDKHKWAKFYKGKKSGFGSMIYRNDCNLPSSEMIRCNPLDKEMVDIKKKINFIKMDTEGEEYRILQGAKNTLTKTDLVVMEFCNDERMRSLKYTLADVMKLFKNSGFDVDKLGNCNKRCHLIARRKKT